MTRIATTSNRAKLNISLTVEEKALLIKLAKAQNTTVSEVIRQQIRILTSAAQAVITHHNSTNTGAAA